MESPYHTGSLAPLPLQAQLTLNYNGTVVVQ